jgi:hypothetical protein
MAANKGPKATVTDVTKRITTKPNKTEGIVNYDVDNAYPQRVNDIINSSGTASLVTAILGKFIYGGGFANEQLAAMFLNESKLTANKLLFKIGKSISKYGGFAIHVNYNALYKKTSFSFVPFQDVRFTTDDEKNENRNMLAVYDDWEKEKSKKILQKNIDFINFYDPDPEAIEEEVIAAGGWDKYNGQLLYWSIDGLEYPLAPLDSVLEDCQTDAHSKTFKNRNITTNFMASYIFRTGKFEGETERQDFVDTLTTFQGQDETSKIMLIEEESEESAFTTEKIDIQDIDKLYEFTEESVRNNIIRNHLIPPVLLVAQAGKLGSSTEIKDATAFYNGVTEDYRRSVEEVFAELFRESMFPPQEEFDILEVKANTVPAKDTTEGKNGIVKVMESALLSDKEKREILSSVYDLTEPEVQKLLPMKAPVQGEEIVPEVIDEGAKAKATLRGSVGGVTSILQIQQSVQAGTTSYEAGQSILEIIFGLSPTDAQRLLGSKQSLTVN